MSTNLSLEQLLKQDVQRANAIKQSPEQIEAVKEMNEVIKEIQDLEKKYQVNGKDPILPRDSKGAVDLLKNYYGQLACAEEKITFLRKYHLWDEERIKSRLKILDAFIGEAQSYSFENTRIEEMTEHGLNLLEYQNVIGSYYLTLFNIPPEYIHRKSRAAIIYGRYVLYHDFLEEKIKRLENPKSGSPNPPNVYNTLKDIFIKLKDYNKAIKPLQKLKIIDNGKNNLIGIKMKGAINVWIYILRYDRQMIKKISDSDLVPLLNKEFTGLNLSERTEGKTLRTSNKTASNTYRAKLLALIN